MNPETQERFREEERAYWDQRDGLLQQTGIDLDDVIHPLLIRLGGAFLDQGMAYWPMPDR